MNSILSFQVLQYQMMAILRVFNLSLMRKSLQIISFYSHLISLIYNNLYTINKTKRQLVSFDNNNLKIKIIMGSFFAKFFKKSKIKDCKLLMLGLDGAGKTTILYNLKLGQVTNTIPTIGFNVEQLKYEKIKFLVWDVGGQQKIRALWKHYFQKTKGLIYIVDSSDSERFTLSCKQLTTIIQDPQLKNTVLLVLANKRDIATISLDAFAEQMKLHKLEKNWAIYPVTAINKQKSGLQQAFQWLIKNIEKSEVPTKNVNIVGL